MAAPITFFYEGFGSGSLDGVPFPMTNFKITCVGDTNDRQSYEVDMTTGFFIDNMSASIEIDGVDTVIFLTGTRIFVNNTFSIVGLSRANRDSIDLFDGPNNFKLSTWDMLSSIGPITGDAILIQWDIEPVIHTSGGILEFDSGETDARFEAITEAPECPADLDGSGEVDFDDLLAMLFAWGPCDGCPEDLDDNGEVGFQDLLEMLFTWGPCL